MEENDEILYIYDKLKDRYDLTLTNTFALNEGYTINLPVLCGKTELASFRLYDDGILVMDIEVNGGECTHIHPLYGDYAVEDVKDFMEGTHWILSKNRDIGAPSPT